jgi:hypothetical protein
MEALGELGGSADFPFFCPTQLDFVAIEIPTRADESDPQTLTTANARHVDNTSLAHPRMKPLFRMVTVRFLTPALACQFQWYVSSGARSSLRPNDAG